MERWLSGRKRLTANEVRALKPFVGSNPTLSALTTKYRRVPITRESSATRVHTKS